MSLKTQEMRCELTTHWWLLRFQMRSQAQRRESFARGCTQSWNQWFSSGAQLPLQVVVGLNPGPATSRLCDLDQLSALLSAQWEINQKMLGKISTSFLRHFCILYGD